MTTRVRGCCRKLFSGVLLLFCILHVSAVPYAATADAPSGFEAFKTAYPDVTFFSVYDCALLDWRITLTYEDRITTLYWAESRFLPQNELHRKEMYSPLLYDYPVTVLDPADFTEEDVTRILEETSVSSRRSNLGTATFFFDFIYDCDTQRAVETHIKKMTFLGKPINLHEKIRSPLAAVEADILALSKTDAEVKHFVDTLQSADGYNWRVISDSGKKSTHSMGIALDILPVGWGQKNVYWAWHRDIVGKEWPLLPLDRRWMPPDKVIAAFENHGFIWGGKWTEWDNMHFEYHPELLEFTAKQEN